MREILVGIQPGPGLPTVGPVSGHVRGRLGHFSGQEAFIDQRKGKPYRYSGYKIMRSNQNYENSGSNLIPK